MLTLRDNHSPIYGIPLKRWDGEENLLENYKGKVTLIINVTGHCGNAPQFGIVEEIYRKYKDQGFEVVAIPTNDFCGPGITYDRFETGVKDAEDARSYAISEYGVSFEFSELVKSNRTEDWDLGDPILPEEIHPLYQEIDKVAAPTGGNFEKYLFNRDGYFIAHFPNGALLDYSVDRAKERPELDQDWKKSSDYYYDLICKTIEEALAA